MVEDRALQLTVDTPQGERGLVWPRETIECAGVGVLGEVLRRARRRLLGDAGADRFRARDVEAVARGLHDPDHRERVWEFAGLRVTVDREEFSIDRADRAHRGESGRRT